MPESSLMNDKAQEKTAMLRNTAVFSCDYCGFKNIYYLCAQILLTT